MRCFILFYIRTEERAAGWYRLTREILKLPEASKEGSKDKSQKTKRPQPLIKLVMRRLERIVQLPVDACLIFIVEWHLICCLLLL